MWSIIAKFDKVYDNFIIVAAEVCGLFLGNLEQPVILNLRELDGGESREELGRQRLALHHEASFVRVLYRNEPKLSVHLVDLERFFGNFNVDLLAVDRGFHALQNGLWCQVDLVKEQTVPVSEHSDGGPFAEREAAPCLRVTHRPAHDIFGDCFCTEVKPDELDAEDCADCVHPSSLRIPVVL